MISCDQQLLDMKELVCDCTSVGESVTTLHYSLKVTKALLFYVK